MRQIIIGHSDSSKLGTYSVGKDEESLSEMPSNTEQRHVPKKAKRFRSAFTTEQTNYLEQQYKKFQYINREQRQKVAKILKIGERPIKIWFQNRRMKEKKENHKEFNDEICDNVQKFGKDRLNNVSDLSSANDSRLYSLPILSFTADTTDFANTNNVKANVEIVDSKNKSLIKPECPNSTTHGIEQKISSPRANFYKEVNSKELLSPYYYQQPTVDTSAPITAEKKNKKLQSLENERIASAEFSINLCKKYKQQRDSTDAAISGNISNEGQNMKTEPKRTLKMETNRFRISQNLPPTKKCKVSYPPPHKLPTQMNLNNQMYYPVMPSIYSPPITSLPPPYGPDGVLWKPFVSVMATNPPLTNNFGHRTPPAHETNNNCICNCHGSSQHIPAAGAIPQSLQNPYAQYVISVPFPHTSTSF